MIQLNKEQYVKLIAEDLNWLHKQPQCLEREHIEIILANSINIYHSLTNEELDKLAEKFVYAHGCENCRDGIDIYKACYRQAKEE